MNEQRENKFFEAGKEVSDAVSEAIRTGDYSTLSRNIKNTVSGITGSSYWEVDVDKRTSARYDQAGWQKTAGTSTSQRRGAYTTRQRTQQFHQAPPPPKTRHQAPPPPVRRAAAKNQVPMLHARTAPGQYSGVVMEVGGFAMAGVFGISALAAAIASAPLLPFICLAAIAAAGLGLGVKGSMDRAFAKRFLQYCRILSKKGYATFAELGACVGRTAEQAKDDLQKMMVQNLFYQGHIDEQETTFMMTNEAYQQYAAAQQSMKERQAALQEEEAKKERLRAEKGLTPEAEKMIDEGRAYIKHIRDCNRDIPGEEISEKLYHLEAIMQKIFDQVEKEPKLAKDLNKFTNYYLPTTSKLVEAYRELDAQPIQGENITKSKLEIEESLDVINEAFEKLLDGFFEDTAWDISSDISVMKTMMAQEGLTEQNDFQVSSGI